MKPKAKQSGATWLSDGVRVELGAQAGDGPKWHLLFPLGRTLHREDFGAKGLTFSADMLQAMASNYEAEGKPERAVNYFHRGTTLPGDHTPIDQKVASGWISDVAFSAKAGELGPLPGLYAQIAFTPKAKAFIQADELRYLSPEFTLSRLNKRTGKEQGPTLAGAALLNDPFLTELPRVAASDTPMEGTMAIDGKKLRKRLKLAETATEEEVEAALEAEDAPDEKPVQLAELTDTLTKLSAELQASKAEVAKLHATQRKAEVEAYVAGLVKQGKVQPSIKEHVVKMGESGGLDAIKFFEKATPVISLDEKGLPGDDKPEGDKKAAGAKVQARLAELQAKGMTALAAMAQTRAELPAEVTLYFSA